NGKTARIGADEGMNESVRVNSLFRTEALKARSAKAAGDIVLASPVSQRVLAAFALAIAASLVAFLALGTYTRHVTIAGELVPDRGVIAVLAPQPGTLVRMHVEEGSRVERGDVLFVLSGERLSAALGETHALIGERLAARRGSLRAQIDEMRLLEQAEETALAPRAAAIEAEVGRLERMTGAQADRVALAEETARRYAEIGAEGFVSQEQLVARRETLLDQRARQSGLEREQAQLERQLAESKSELENLPLRYKHKAAELERAIAGIDLEITENEARREAIVVAPIAGIATAIGGKVGQVVDAGAPLLSIVPGGSRLRAELSAPSRAIGFVDAGSEVLLRYPAYPYQKFGHHPARVITVSRAALPVERGTPAAGSSRDPLYRIVAEIGSQAVDVYGEPRLLRAGMLVEADVKLEKRRLYEWVLEPLYALKVRASGSGAL